MQWPTRTSERKYQAVAEQIAIREPHADEVRAEVIGVLARCRSA